MRGNDAKVSQTPDTPHGNSWRHARLSDLIQRSYIQGGDEEDQEGGQGRDRRQQDRKSQKANKSRSDVQSVLEVQYNEGQVKDKLQRLHQKLYFEPALADATRRFVYILE